MPASFCSHILSTRPCVSVAESDYSASAETRKPIYRIRRCCNAMSEYSPMHSISLTLIETRELHLSTRECDFPGITHTHTHPFNDPLSETTQVSRYGISWAICKSALRSRQITTPAPHHSVFTGRMLFLPPNQQRQSTEGHS